jgi:hypothetical protein
MSARPPDAISLSREKTLLDGRELGFRGPGQIE